MKYLLLLLLFTSISMQGTSRTPVKMGVAGLTHGHVNWVFTSHKNGEIEITGIAEPDRALAERYAKRYGMSMNIIYPTLKEMLDAGKPEAVSAFGSIFQHLEVVEACAPRGIHVMVEKPLAVSVAHATRMAELARKHNIHLITNYETTWYATNHALYELVHTTNAIGDIRKMVIHDGHQGPKEIGVGPEFLAWLTDPIQNGGGAIIDFGCYGTNLATWMMKGEKPVSIMAVTQQIKPDIYPKVDDEATIVITYPKAQAIIQASWNWPFSRKDMEVYGQTGYLLSDDRHHLRMRFKDKEEESIVLKDRESPYTGPFAFFTAVVRGEVAVKPTDLSSLENNLMVVTILETARESARTGKVIMLK